jgi:hypothetical protein
MHLVTRAAVIGCLATSLGLPLDAVGIGRALSQGAQSPRRLTLARLVDPATRIDTGPGPLRFQSGPGHLRFALHGLIWFDTLEELFAYIDAEAGRWQFGSETERRRFADALMHRGVESRIVSMETELPLEVVLTHRREDIAQAVADVKTTHAPLIFRGRHWQLHAKTYEDAILRVRDRWLRSLNCWSASPSIPGRVMSNWYIIDEGITLFGAPYDSTEHFWQAVKFHPDVTVNDLRTLLTDVRRQDWRPWLDSMRADQKFYFANAYAVEFLAQNLTAEHLTWFDAELTRAATGNERVRAAQQRADRRVGAEPRFTALTEKILWGDLADVFHLIVAFGNDAPSPPAGVAAVRRALIEGRFDGIYLDGYAGGHVGFLSPEFQALMLEIWKVKFLQIPRFVDVIRSTAGVRLDHFLNDGDSPDIPIPVYVGYLNRIRDMAMEGRR